jgi:hypothetical protein
MNTPGDWQQEAPTWPGATDPMAPAAAWAVGLDTQAPLGFRELGILSQIGELTGAAADRLRGHEGGPIAG